MTDHFAVNPGWSRSVVCPEAGERGVRMLWYQDLNRWAVEHICKQIDADGSRLICAPRLMEGHVVESTDPLTISPSILCPDCGLHGYVRSNRWVSV